MSLLIVKNVNFHERISPKDSISKKMTEREAFKAMVEKVDELRQTQGWTIEGITANEFIEGFTLKLTAKDGLDYFTNVYVRV